MKKFKFISTLILVGTVLITQAQDLIKDTRNGVHHSAIKKKMKPNNISKKVQQIFENRGYMTSKAFNLVKNQQKLVAKNSTDLKDAVYLETNKSEIAKILQTSPNSLKLQIPITKSNSIDLQLIKNNFLSKGFEIITSQGTKYDLHKSILFYKGIVNGDPSSLAAISISDGEINGIVSDKNGNYNLGTLKNDATRAVLYNSKHAKTNNEFNCGNESLDKYYSNEKLKINKTETTVTTPKTEKTGCDSNDCVGIYFEVAEDLYKKLGSVKEVVKYVTAAFNSVSMVFENEEADNGNSREMKVCLSSIFIWTTDDIYYGRRGARLKQFLKQLNNYNFPGAIALVLSYIPGDSGGFAYTGPFRNLTSGVFEGDTVTGMFEPGLCHNHIPPNSSTSNRAEVGPFGSVTFNLWYKDYPIFSRDVDLIAHETGHIFGSPHTHACAWTFGNQAFKAIDDCGPTQNNGVENFYQNTINSADGPILHTCTFDDTLEGTNDPSLMSYCGNIPLTEGFGEKPGQLMYNNYLYGIDNNCFPVENRDNVFAEFTFLNSLVSQTNCSNERISVFRDGNDSYVYVKTDAFTRLYNATGTVVLCEEGTDISCICKYNLYEIDNYWACCSLETDPAEVQVLQNCECENDDSIFETYNFLNVDPNNCNGKSVTVYGKYEVVFNSLVYKYYVYLKTATGNTLYNKNGSELCSSTGDDTCINNLAEENEVLKWTCCKGIESQIWGCKDIEACNYKPQADTDDGSCTYTGCNSTVCQGATSTFPWLSDYIPSGTCVEIFNYMKNGFNFLYLKYDNEGYIYLDQYTHGNLYANDIGDGSAVISNSLGNVEERWSCGCEIEISGCTDASACNYNSQAITDDGSCEYTSCNPTPSICDDVYANYPWLSSITPANTCVEIYDYLANDNYWNLIYIKYNGRGELYLNNGEGVFFGSDNGDGSVVRANNISNLINQWYCGCDGSTPVSECTDPYPWLSNIIPANTCVEIYDYLANDNYWHLIYIKYNGRGELYLNNGQGIFFGSDNGDGSVVKANNLSNLINQWYCGCDGSTPVSACTDPYPWLSSITPANTCAEIYDYLANDNYWHLIYVKYNGRGELYLNNGEGIFYGSDNGDGSVVKANNLSNLIDQWSCGCSQFKFGDKLTPNALVVMPNPNNGLFSLVLPQTVNENTRAEIYSIEGKQIKTIELDKAVKQRIDISGFSSGLYLIKVVSDSYSSTQRFTIK